MFEFGQHKIATEARVYLVGKCVLLVLVCMTSSLFAYVVNRRKQLPNKVRIVYFSDILLEIHFFQHGSNIVSSTNVFDKESGRCNGLLLADSSVIHKHIF